MRIKITSIIVLLLTPVLALTASAEMRGNLEPPGPPDSTSSYTLEDIYNRLNEGTEGAPSTFTEPSSGPGTATGYTLDEVMAKAPASDNTHGAVPSQVLTGTTYWSLRTDGTWGPQAGIAAMGNNVSGPDGDRTFNIPDGFYTGKTATANDADLAPGNVKQGVNILGVSGTVIEATGDATAPDVLTGKTFSIAGAAGMAGTMPNNGALVYTPGTTAQMVAGGYHNGLGYVEGDADLLTWNIKAGVDLFGVTGYAHVVDTSSGNAVASELLQEKIAWVDGAEVIGTMPDNGAVIIEPAITNQAIAQGYHNGSGYMAGDADLLTRNIKDGVVIFGVTGIFTATGSAPVPRTGQTASILPGDDGDWEMGMPWPNPRFTDNGDGTITDNLTGLIWLKNANCLGPRTWTQAIADANGLENFYCGLGDGSSAGDWRLPNLRELQSLLHYGVYQPALPNTTGTGKWAEGDPFTGLQTAGYYWTSTDFLANSLAVWCVIMSHGLSWDCGKQSNYYVWPVRGGQ